MRVKDNDNDSPYLTDTHINDAVPRCSISDVVKNTRAKYHCKV
jgi:hypothetical protein